MRIESVEGSFGADQGRIFKVLSKGDQVKGALRIKFMIISDWYDN